MRKFCLILIVLLVAPIGFAKQLCAIDDNGIKVCLHSAPKRIISLAPSATELLYAAGAGKQLVAVDKYSDFPEAAKKLPKVGGYPNINAEVLVNMAPDLIVVWAGGNSPELIQQIARMKLKLFQLNAVNLKDIGIELRKLGAITGNVQQANFQADRFDRRLARLQTTYQHQTPISVFFEIWHTPLMAVGADNIMNRVITLCGGRNIFADVKIHFPIVSIESLLAKNPDVILITSPQNKARDRQTLIASYQKKWVMLSAVQKKQLFIIDSDMISRPTPRILDGAEKICQYLKVVRENKYIKH
ncbi:MAG: cobalamin-binding protein [Endozoicomonas sp. (ex Botrylloides leachii)]|nr:cobalamin-binding protein [Endozoicomonas sp. (ex Botrylloides leachii)]